MQNHQQYTRSYQQKEEEEQQQQKEDDTFRYIVDYTYTF